MIEETLRELIARGESAQMEFKSTTGSLTAGVRTVCAFLNGKLPGWVVFGVRDDGQLAGQDVGASTQEDIARELRRLDPPAFPDVNVVNLANGRSAIVLQVPGGTGLYCYDGRPYHRVGATTGVMPRDLYERRIIERHHAVQRWENQPAPDSVTLADLDEQEIRRTLDNAIRLGRLAEPRERNPEAILRGLELIVDDRLLNAAVALYGASSRLTPSYPQLMVRMARFRGVNSTADFLDNRQEWGHAFQTLERAERFLREHVPIAGRLRPDSWIRQDRPRYPPLATREAIANAICHRDYTIGGGAVTVAIYDDRLEIGNTGPFHFGVTPEALTRPHESKPWNPIIAGVFYRAGIIEKWGFGTLNILHWCEENASPPPTWEEWSGSSVVVTFLPAAPFEEEQLESELESELESGTSSLERRVLLTLADGALSKSAIAARLGQAQPSGPLHEAVRSLVTRGLVKYTIPDKPNSRLQQYRLTYAGRTALASPGNEVDRLPRPG